MNANTLTMPNKKAIRKFYGKCLLPDGDTVTLAVQASDEAEASRRLHKNYRISMVMDFLTKEQLVAERMKQKRSLLQSVNYL